MADDNDDPVDVTKLSREVADWEYVSRGMRSYTQRKAVPGGWIYRTVVEGHPAICFVPDAAAPASESEPGLHLRPLPNDPPITFATTTPSDVTFAFDSVALFTIKPDGTIERGPAFTTEDEMSLRFWTMVGDAFPAARAGWIENQGAAWKSDGGEAANL